MSDKITLKSVAAALGISHMTVSRALTGSPKVTEATRRLVVETAQKMGYVTHNAARLLRGKRSSVVGLSLPNLDNEFYATLASAVEDVGAVHGLQVLIGLTHDDPKRERQVLQQFRIQRVGAIAIVPTTRPDQYSSVPDVALIQVLRRATQFGTDVIQIDDGPAIEAAVAFLIGKGARRIAYLGADRRLSTGRLRLLAFRRAMKAAALDADLFRTVSPDTQSGRRGLDEIVGLSPPAEALILGGVQISNGAIERALELGLRVPKDLRIIGYGNPTWYRWVFGGVPSIELPTRALADQIVLWCLDVSGAAACGIESIPHLRAEFCFNVGQSSHARPFNFT